MSGTGQQLRSDISPTTDAVTATLASPLLSSKNFRKVQFDVKTAIYRANAAGSKAAEEAHKIIDDTLANRDALGLKNIDELRKQMLVISGMIETNSHFHQFVSKAKLHLSAKEIAELCQVATDHLDLKPRTDTLPILKEAILELKRVLEEQGCQCLEKISPTEIEDIAENVENTPQENEEPFVDDSLAPSSDFDPNQEELFPRDGDLAPTTRRQHPSSNGMVDSLVYGHLASATAHETVGINNPGGTQVPPVVSSDIRSNTENHEASSLPLGTAPNRASPGLSISCPVCRGSHDLFDCDSPKLPAYCARNQLCVLCMSSDHLTLQCQIHFIRSSPILSGAINKMYPGSGGRFMTSDTQIVASTPSANVPSNFHSLSDSERKEHARTDWTLAPESRNEVSSEEDAYDECRAAERDRKIRSNNYWLSFYDLESILP
ncbi:hypothetical protein CRE_16489 [Caenorhabditis remanei]|uniref:Uncharacterized protein n=1 Tax=Caenorhabditis remanei TaxID=31234 RepID=E3NKU1_CAERE|nr:hypothetical protein CRE_16489 [Caenorhabditis remanei]